MFGAGEYLEMAFGLSKSEAREVLAEWMTGYDPEEEEEDGLDEGED